MSSAAATASAPTGQAPAQITSTPPAAGAAGSTPPVATPATTTDPKPTASVLGSVEEPKPGDPKKEADAVAAGDPKKSDASEIEIKLPDGIEVDQATLGEFRNVAKEIGLTSETASKLVAWNVAQRVKETEASVASWQMQGETWMKELESDPDFGGPKLAENVLAAKSALRRFGGPQVAAELEKFGMGNHPGLVRMLARIGKAIKEDSSGVDSGKTAPAPDAQAQLQQLYPSMFKTDGSQRTQGA